MTAPTGVRNYSNTATQATLTGAIGATDTSIALSTATGDPSAPFTAALARGTASEEIVLVTALVGSTATVTRGYDNTTAKAQPAGTTFQEVVVALDFREANNHVNATGSVHGLTSGLVGVSDTQTLTNKTVTLVAGTVAGTPAGAADLVRKDYADGLFNTPPAARVVPAFLGSGTAYPASPVRGDTFSRTDLGPSFMRYNGSVWRQVEPCELTNYAAISALPTGSLYPGFQALDTSTGAVCRWSGSGWFRPPGQLPPTQILESGFPSTGGAAASGGGLTGITSVQLPSPAAGPSRPLRLDFQGVVASTSNAAGYAQLFIGPNQSLTGATAVPGSQVRVHNNGQANAPLVFSTRGYLTWDASTYGQYITIALNADPSAGALQFVTTPWLSAAAL